jgi:multidrug resistance protein MdtO
VIWIQRFCQDLQPTPGRLNVTLRAVLATSITLVLLMTWQIPASAYGLYIVLMVARDSPSVSIRGGISSIFALSIAVATEIGIVAATNNDPMCRILAIPVVAFIAGMAIRATTIPFLAVTWGFVICTLMANWEFQSPPELVVKNSMWLAGAGALAISNSVAVEYVFGVTNPVASFQEQFRVRYRAVENMFSAIASGAGSAEVSTATIQVARLAASGQTAMQELYGAIVDRNLDPGTLPVGSRVQISMLAQLMDISTAFGSHFRSSNDPRLAERCAQIAAQCHQLALPGVSPQERCAEFKADPPSTLLDRIESVLHSIRCMPHIDPSPGGKELIALPAKEVPLLIPGALENQDNVAFALKLSLCATICYVFYHAVGWPGISTAVTTVFFTATGSTGGSKQKLSFRVLGAAIGGLIFGIGSEAFLFPQMDSITSLVVLVAIVAFISEWCATGRYFGYVGLQIALAFYFVALQGFGPPLELAPARDRFVGILVGLIAMWFIFDQLWPVRTVTVMRRNLATVLRSEASLLRLGEAGQPREKERRQANALRDQVGKTVAGLRTLNDAVEFEFGVNKEVHLHSSQAILRAAFVAGAMFWNQLVILLSSDDEDFLRDPKLIEMRRAIATELNTMAEVDTAKTTYVPARADSSPDTAILEYPRYEEYVRNTVNRFAELQEVILSLSTESQV